MGYAIGTLTKGGGDDCHYQLLAVIKTLAEANGWVTLRYDTGTANHELILQGEGLSGTEEIFVGFQCYQNITSDYYNINCGVFVGYVAENSFSSQPGGKYYSTPGHNNSITYFISCNPQRITGGLRVGTPVYETFYVGKGMPYFRPGEYPSFLICAAMANSGSSARFSSTTQTFPFAGYRSDESNNKLSIRDQSGNWIRANCYPFTQGDSKLNSLAGPQGSGTMVPAGDSYQIEPIIMYQDKDSIGDYGPSNVFGEFDGVYFCTGFNNAVENVIQVGGSSVIDQSGLSVVEAVDDIISVGGRALVMIQNVYRTEWHEFVAMEMV